MNQVNLNSSKILNFKATQQAQIQQIPQMPAEQSLPDFPLPGIYNVSETKETSGFKESLKKVDMMDLVLPWIEHPFMMAETCAGLAWGVDKFSAACGGEYETSLVGKAARFGDKIQESKFVQSKPFQSIWGIGEKAVNKFNRIFRNSDVINAMKKTPSEAEWKFVKGELLTMQQRVAEDFTHVVNKLIRPEYRDKTPFTKLADLGVDKNEYEFIKKFFNGRPIEEQASNAIQLKRIGLADDAIRDILSKPDATNIVKSKQLEKLGIDQAFLDKIAKNPATKDDIAKIQEACKKAKNIRISEGHKSWLGKFQIFKRKIGLAEIGNRLTSMSEPAANGAVRTKTGKIMATFLQKCHRGFTFGGGKMGVLFFVSPLLVRAMLDVKKAEPDQKAGTAAHGLVHSVSWVFTFPLALTILHRFGGMKYAGMSKEAVLKSRELIKEFNEKVKNGTFKSYNEYKDALKELKVGADGKSGLKALRTVKDQNLITKICKKVGSFLTMDLETIKAYKGPGSFNLRNIGKKASNVLRNVGGVPLRVGIWAGLTMGVLDGIINKGLKTCFGGHYDRFKEEELESAKKEQKKFLKQDLKSRLIEANREKVYGLNSTTQTEENPVIKEDKYQAVIAEKMMKKMGKINETETNTQVKENATIKSTEANTQVKENTTIKSEETKTENLTKQNNNIQEQKANEKPNETPDEKLKKEQIAKTPTESSIEPAEEKTEPTLVKEPLNEALPEKTGEKASLTSEEKELTPTVQNLNNKKTYPAKTTLEATKPVKRDNYTYIPSSENVIKTNKTETEERKYIPSQKGAKFSKTFDNSGLEAALKRADRAEKRALETLAGNFNSY